MEYFQRSVILETCQLLGTKKMSFEYFGVQYMALLPPPENKVNESLREFKFSRPAPCERLED